MGSGSAKGQVCGAQDAEEIQGISLGCKVKVTQMLE